VRATAEMKSGSPRTTVNGRKKERRPERRRPEGKEDAGTGRQRMKPRKGRETSDSEVTEAPTPTVRDEIDAAFKKLWHISLSNFRNSDS